LSVFAEKAALRGGFSFCQSGASRFCR